MALLEKHNDGSCYKLTIHWMIDPEDGLSSERIVYSEDIDELFEEAKRMSDKHYCYDIRIQDDSK